MSDTRPFAPIAEYGRRHMGWPDSEPETPDPVADFIERATNAHDAPLGLVFAQLAATEQLRKLTTAVEAAAESIRELLEAGEDR